MGISITNIKYNYPDLLYKNRFYSFNNQLNYILIYYFTKLEIIKYNINKFLFYLFIALFIKKLFYKNADK